jgi:hypothetical protein
MLGERFADIEVDPAFARLYVDLGAALGDAGTSAAGHIGQ